MVLGRGEIHYMTVILKQKTIKIITYSLISLKWSCLLCCGDENCVPGAFRYSTVGTSYEEQMTILPFIAPTPYKVINAFYWIIPNRLVPNTFLWQINIEIFELPVLNYFGCIICIIVIKGKVRKGFFYIKTNVVILYVNIP